MFNVGRKDEYGKQRRIEHRGRFVRASRTGGVALRAQARAAGVSLSGNTRRGVRVSATPARNTQVAVQNGRFILLGRYSAGPLRLNLSKSGLSLSARNRMGSFNLTNPGRSSAKIAGVQMRGKTAAGIQAVYGAFATMGVALQAMWWLGSLLLRVLFWLVVTVWNTLVAIPGVLASVYRWLRHAAPRSRATGWRGRVGWPEGWGSTEYQAALVLAYCAWGRGELAEAWARAHTREAEGGTGEHWWRVARELDDRLPEGEVGARDVRLRFAALAQALGESAPDADPAELLLQADDLTTQDTARTRMQDAFIELYADVVGLRFDVDPAEAERLAAESEAEADQPTASDAPLNINTAPVEALEALPRIGEARAREIVARRPFRALDELASIHGIGEGTVEQLREMGVRCE